MWLWLVAFCQSIATSIARALLTRGLSIATRSTCFRSALIFFFSLHEFGINPIVGPIGVEELSQCCAAASPLLWQSPSNATNSIVVVRQAATLPIVHDQKHVRADFGCAEVHGIREEIRRVQRHPRSAHRAVSQYRFVSEQLLTGRVVDVACGMRWRPDRSCLRARTLVISMPKHDDWFRVIVLADGENTVCLRSFNEVQKYLEGRSGEDALRMARTLNLAQSEDQKHLAVLAFREWARLNGSLIELRAA